MSELDGFREYLQEQEFRPGTVGAYLGTIRFALEAGDGDVMLAIRRAKSPGRRQQIRAAALQYARYIGGEEGMQIRQDILDMPRSRTREKAPERPLSGPEYSAVLRAVKEEQAPLRHILALLVLTGLRIGDILDIEHDRAAEGLDTGTMYVRQKGGGYRPYPVLDDVRVELRQLDEGWEWDVLRQLVSRGRTDNAAYMVIYRAMKRLGPEAGIDADRIHPHLFRSTAASILWRETRDIYIVMKFLGHKNIATTERYLKWIAPEDLDDAYRALSEGRRR